MAELIVAQDTTFARYHLDHGTTVLLAAGGALQVQPWSPGSRPNGHVLGAVTITAGGDAFHLSAARSPAYLNTDTRPLATLRRLADKDRLTYFLPAGVIRVWYDADGRGIQPYDGHPPQASCGYCLAALSAGESVAHCPHCRQVTHAECLAETHGYCPRCDGQVETAAWFPQHIMPDETAEEEDGAG